MKRLLIANRGEIARRVQRTAQAMGIQTVAVHSEADAGALHVREATAAVAIGGAAPAASYLCTERLVAAAVRSGADAVHPGYGFLSENAGFAQAVIDAGLTWVGPPPAAMRALGSKSAAKALALSCGVPVLPGSAGHERSDEALAQAAQRIGFPVMVKAVAGGGGRGMRRVERAEALAAALASAREEALLGFGSEELLIERALNAPRHVEVQVFADAHGRCVHLGERDCSVQRRHQKLIEEAPSPAVDAALRERLGEAAVALARAAGYVGAGTVEFLLDGQDFYLMEMNTRLQVEHPVTEMLTGLDLVEWQLRVARGEPLPAGPVAWRGHAIEVRVCAEDDRFVPHSGRVAAFAEPPAQAGQRFDHALEAGQVVSPHYDSLLGKLIVHAPTREQALARLAAALDATVLLGLPTNRALLAACLRHPVFAAGAAHTGFLAEHAEALRAACAPPAEAVLGALLAAAYPAGAAVSLPCGWARPLRWRHGECVLELSVWELGGGALRVQAGEHTHTVRRGEGSVAIDGFSQPVQALALAQGAWQVQIGPHRLDLQDLSFAPREAAAAAAAAAALELRAPFNGRLVQVHTLPGAPVARGDTLFTLESMKIQHRLEAPRDGTVAALHVAPGQQVAPGQLLLCFVESP